jgi:hypothetical protein
MRKFLLVTLLIAVIAWIFPQPEAQAFDPVTLSLLAPVAMEAAKTASPIVLKWLSGVGKVMLKMGKDTLEIFLLPVGLMEVIFGTPFARSCFTQGCRFMLKGSVAPFKLCFHTLLLPLAFFGVNFK